MSLLALLESMQQPASPAPAKRPAHAVEPQAGTLAREIWDRIREDWTPVGEITAPWRGRRKIVPRYLLEFMDRGLVERRGKHSKTEYRRTVP